MYEIERKDHCRFQAGDAKRRLVKLQRLLVRMMRRMIGRDRVDGPIVHRSQYRVDMLALRSGGLSWYSCRIATARR